jgi:hypothetical protein
MPLTRDVTTSPIVTALVIPDPANAADFVPYLNRRDEVSSSNARRVLCLFGVEAVPVLAAALVDADIEARKEGVEVLWTMLVGEPAWAVRETLMRIQPELLVLLDDKRPLPDHLPEYVERDFEGRICDLTFLVLQQAMNPQYDQSLFRSFDDSERDDEIARLKRRGLGNVVA